MTPFTDAGHGVTNLTFWAKQHLMLGVYDSTDGTRGGCDLDEEFADKALALAWKDVERHYREQFAKELEAEGRGRYGDVAPTTSHVAGFLDAAASLQGSR